MKLSHLPRIHPNLFWIVAAGFVLYGLRPRPSGPTVQTLDGELTELKPNGRPLLVEAFASWCVACQRSASALEGMFSLSEKHSIDVVAVSVDADVSDARRAAANWPIHAPVFHDNTGEFARAFSVQVLPTYVLIGTDGRVLDVHSGTAGASTFRTWIRAAEPPKLPAANKP
jgi:thiol-disulfide isomerase/thioredoxin